MIYHVVALYWVERSKLSNLSAASLDGLWLALDATNVSPSSRGGPE